MLIVQTADGKEYRLPGAWTVEFGPPSCPLVAGFDAEIVSVTSIPEPIPDASKET